MKRSEVNALIRRADAFIRSHGVHLPPFADWTPEEWAAKGPECDEIRECMLGWDVTDYGLGRFSDVGLVLFTLRTGRQGDARRPKPYAEKLLISQEGQVCPTHFHWHKTEDIINRAGGVLEMQLHNSRPDGTLDTAGDVSVSQDGVLRCLPAGTVLRLLPGESVTLTTGLYHAFWAAKGSGPVLIGEVSQCNDDVADNRFLDPIGRFPSIEEDEPAYRLLCTEYPAAP